MTCPPSFTELNHLANISPTVGCRSQKVKDSAIMPNIVGIRLQFSQRDVGDEPMDPLRRTPQPLLAGCDGSLRDIEYRDFGITATEEVVHKR
jgi:hypothetical protein